MKRCAWCGKTKQLRFFRKFGRRGLRRPECTACRESRAQGQGRKSGGYSTSSGPVVIQQYAGVRPVVEHIQLSAGEKATWNANYAAMLKRIRANVRTLRVQDPDAPLPSVRFWKAGVASVKEEHRK